MKTAVHAQTLKSYGSWPFPAADHFRKNAATSKAPSTEVEGSDHEDKIDHAEQELVQEQKERDRKAAHAVDPNRKDRPPPQG